MTVKKKIAGHSKLKIRTWFENDVIEQRAALKQFAEFAKQLARDPAESRRLLQRAGILTKAGRLTRHYR